MPRTCADPSRKSALDVKRTMARSLGHGSAIPLAFCVHSVNNGYQDPEVHGLDAVAIVAGCWKIVGVEQFAGLAIVITTDNRVPCCAPCSQADGLPECSRVAIVPWCATGTPVSRLTRMLAVCSTNYDMRTSASHPEPPALRALAIPQNRRSPVKRSRP